MLFPDLFQWPNPSDGSIVEDYNYTADEWKQLEDAGCVFLIAAGTGNKNGGSLENPGSGYYWSSTPNPTTNIKTLKFVINSQTKSIIDVQSDWGCCVRLVYDPNYTTTSTGK